jgi:gluconolactonase
VILPIESFEVFATGLDHPECLAFDREGVVWAGGEAGQIYRIDAAANVTQVADFGGFNAGLAWTPDDRELYVCNGRHGVVAMKRSGEWSVVMAAVDAQSLQCPNYGVFTRRGDYYFTDSGKWKRRNGRLLVKSPSGSSSVVIDRFGYANGLALSADEQYLFLVESDTNSIHRVNLASGAVEVYAESVGRMPDGLALDASGYLYCCCYASDDIHRIDAVGKVERFAWDRWAILLSRPTNMAFYEEYVYVCNLGRTTITRARAGVEGSPLANLQCSSTP